MTEKDTPADGFFNNTDALFVLVSGSTRIATLHERKAYCGDPLNDLHNFRCSFRNYRCDAIS